MKTASLCSQSMPLLRTTTREHTTFPKNQETTRNESTRTQQKVPKTHRASRTAVAEHSPQYTGTTTTKRAACRHESDAASSDHGHSVARSGCSKFSCLVGKADKRVGETRLQVDACGGVAKVPLTLNQQPRRRNEAPFTII